MEETRKAPDRALREALTEGEWPPDPEATCAALERGADPNALDADGCTPLMHAVLHPRLSVHDDPFDDYNSHQSLRCAQCVSLLLDAGADPTRVWQNGGANGDDGAPLRTALGIAREAGHEAAAVLLEDAVRKILAPALYRRTAPGSRQR